MISREEAIAIAKSVMPEPGYNVVGIQLVNKIWTVGLKKDGRGFEVEIDAVTGKVIGGGGG